MAVGDDGQNQAGDKRVLHFPTPQIRDPDFSRVRSAQLHQGERSAGKADKDRTQNEEIGSRVVKAEEKRGRNETRWVQNLSQSPSHSKNCSKHLHSLKAKEEHEKI